MGAWIETDILVNQTQAQKVAPLVGAWIETAGYTDSHTDRIRVAPLVGAWIETNTSSRRNGISSGGSRPLWARELKRLQKMKWQEEERRAPCGRVNWNLVSYLMPRMPVSRALCGRVNWNPSYPFIFCSHRVAPLVGAWIETFCPPSVNLSLLVAPLVGAWIE